MFASNREDVADLKPGIDGTAADIDHHVVVLGLAVVGQIACHNNRFGVFGVDRSVVGVLAADRKRFAVLVFAAEVIQTAGFDQNFIKDRRSGRPVRTAVSNRQARTCFSAVVLCRTRHRHVVKACRAVGVVVAGDRHIFGLRGIHRTVVGVIALDFVVLTARCVTHNAGAADFNKHFVPFGRSDVGMYTALGNRELVAAFITFVVGVASVGDGHVVVSGRPGVGDFADNSRQIGFGCVKLAAGKVFKRAVDDKGVTLGVAADLKAAVFVAARIRHRTVDRRVVPNRRPGIGVFTVHRENVAGFKTCIDGAAADIDHHVVVLGLTVVGQIACHNNRFGVFGVDRSVVGVLAADRKRFAVLVFAAEVIQTAGFDQNFIKDRRSGRPVRTAVSNRQARTCFSAVVLCRTRHRHVVKACRAVGVVVAGDRHIFGLRGIHRTVVGVIALDFVVLTARCVTHNAGAADFNKHFVPFGRSDVGMYTALGNRELVAAFITFVVGVASVGDGHVVVSGRPGVGDFADNSRQIGFGCVKLAAGKVFKRAVDDKGVTLGVAADLKAAVFVAARIRHRTVDRRVVPNRRPGIGVFGTLSNSEISALFIAGVFPRAEFDGHVFIEGCAFVVHPTVKHHVGIDVKHGVFTDVVDVALKFAVFQRSDRHGAGIVDRCRQIGIDIADFRYAACFGLDQTAAVIEFITRKAACNMDCARVHNGIRVQDAAGGHVNRTFVGNFPSSEFAVLGH